MHSTNYLSNNYLFDKKTSYVSLIFLNQEGLHYKAL